MCPNDGKIQPPNNLTIKVNLADVSYNPNVRLPPTLILVAGSPSNIGRQWTLEKADSSLGRNPECDIQLGEGGLSKVHAKITVAGDEVTITDLGSTNKTIVNQSELTPNQPVRLKNNDQIQTGTLLFRFLQKGIVSETAEKARMQEELEQARRVQSSLLPAQPECQYQSVKVAGRYRPASETGGDWWWHWATPSKVFVLIADVTGHGAGAALMTSAARTAVAMMEDDASMEIAQVYKTLSQAIAKASGGAHSMSAYIVEYDRITHKLRYINASHLPAVLLPPFSSAPGAKPSWTQLNLLAGEASAFVGASEQNFSIADAEIKPGERLVLMTDGLSERKVAGGEMLSDRQFYSMLIESQFVAHHTASEYLDYLIKRSDELAQGSVQEDDITVVLLDFL